MPNAGVHRAPLSEGGALASLVAHLKIVEDHPYDTERLHHLAQAIRIAQRLQEQVKFGVHLNPPGLTFKGRGPFGTDVEEMRYRHTSDGKLYKHDFDPGVEVYAVVRNGKKELLLSHESGLPLWDDFPD